MEFITSASTDVGIKKDVNQDNLFLTKGPTKVGNICFAIICDGMGGYSDGEVASEAVMNAFKNWVENTLPSLLYGTLDDNIIREQWENIIYDQNNNIRNYGNTHNITLGTTVTAVLLTEERWFCVNVGDTRAYEISKGITQLTIDHSLIGQNLKKGIITYEEAKQSKNRNVLTQCVGIAKTAEPDFFFGETKTGVLYMLCSDGFRNEVTDDEIYEAYKKAAITDSVSLKACESYLIELNKNRGETDNISVVSIITSE